ncbi:transcription antiterminator BglG [Enterococcus sp. JM4C]|uniref:sigma 54-interacting transcriptional regulator n=1 Tax=Candidatus Enterococcus huntleyi TaxID=1857217 RepID=UPI001379C92D|nr:sigma-54-dependent transcriptional regulator [Enterococcus sp. JM4C]KAF1297120.1 transcription antiterminator BglG [Enterococcus sp. JM4C]
MKKELDEYLYEWTINLSNESKDRLSAHEIGEALKLTRSTVSSYLNQAVREGELVKIKSYPVLFLHKRALEAAKFTVDKNEYLSLDELMSEGKNHALAEIIGATGSLKEAIDQIKTAVLYPHNGLPILLMGMSGSGKTFLAERIHQYAIEEQVITSDAPFISYNCAQYYNNPELLSSALFGHTKGAFTGADQTHYGLIEKAHGGILFLDEVHRLSEEGQEKLFTFMDTGEFSPMGDTSIRQRADVRLIFATTENVYSTFLPTFLRRLPVIVNLPKFQHRPQSERLSLIDAFFIAESNILSKELQVSSQLVDFLLNSDLEGNVGKIKNIIKYACGSAYVHQKQEISIQVRLRDLPLEFSLKFKEQFSKPKKKLPNRRYLPNTSQQIYLESKQTQLLKEFFWEMLTEFKKVQQQISSSTKFIEAMANRVTQIMDEFMFQETYQKEESFYSVLTYHIRQTIDMMYENYGFEQDGHRVVSLASYLYLKDNADILGSHYEWQEQKTSLLEFLDTSLENTYWYAKKLLSHLSQQLDQDLFEEDIVFVAFYFYSLHINDLPSDVKSIVLAHGYSTASSLANVVNRMLEKNVFQAYDMPINITLDKVESQIIRYLNEYRTDAGLILLVDMGSFNQLGERLAKHIQSPMMIIDNVSTPLVLEVGSHIVQGASITEIYEAISVEKRIQKQLIIPEVNKKKAIITCCYTGLGSATQIQEILLKCLGESAKELVILPYDYKKLLQNKLYEAPFQLYDVLMIVGTESPKIHQVPYISVDKLINGEAVEEFANLLHSEISLDAQILKSQLIFNFSINKIVENLTILDANKVLLLVQRAVKEMEELMGIDFSNNQLFLLYMHCCSMIERILRKETVDEQEDIDDYIQQEGKNMELIHKAFQEVEKEYTIELPILELRLLNDIVKD